MTRLPRGTDSLHFCYDAADRPIFVDYNGTMYVYVHNLQGDIVGILDSIGTLVVAWIYSLFIQMEQVMQSKQVGREIYQWFRKDSKLRS